MPKRWSKIQKEIYNLFDEEINLQIHCSAIRMDSQYGTTNLPRYWITLDKEIIFDYPKQFLNTELSSYDCKRPKAKHRLVGETYPYTTDVSIISKMIRDYIDMPIEDLLDHSFEFDNWRLTDILKAADRRIGKKRLKDHFEDTKNEAVKKILVARHIMG